MTSVRIETIGAEAQPLVILDDFAPDPDRLRSFAQAADFTPALNHFPGVRAALPAASSLRDTAPHHCGTPPLKHLEERGRSPSSTRAFRSSRRRRSS